MDYAWAQNLDGIYYRTIGFCEAEDCGSTQGCGGKFPDRAMGGGIVRGAYFFECEVCGGKSYFSVEERERRMDAIFEAQKVEQAVTPWEILRYGREGRVQMGPVEFDAEVIGYGRDPMCGYVLNGTMIVRTTAQVRSWYRKDALVDIGVVAFTPYPV